jgi:hypothetical protein
MFLLYTWNTGPEISFLFREQVDLVFSSDPDASVIITKEVIQQLSLFERGGTLAVKALYLPPVEYPEAAFSVTGNSGDRTRLDTGCIVEQLQVIIRQLGIGSTSHDQYHREKQLLYKTRFFQLGY